MLAQVLVQAFIENNTNLIAEVIESVVFAKTLINFIVQT
jgi:hypothetical protein